MNYYLLQFPVRRPRMPCTVKISVVGARNLPVMDKRSGSTDSYVVVRFGEQMRRTEVQWKTLNPKWNQSFKFEISDDADLLCYVVELRVWDYDVVVTGAALAPEVLARCAEAGCRVIQVSGEE
ncbi:MAG: hypothetical protein KJ699_15655 [Alphaproteobacteria bacterium]|nr:hypothetical protein [Alphaproteobacteria bacterium]